jgi:multiple sugar transport system permease protein
MTPGASGDGAADHSHAAAAGRLDAIRAAAGGRGALADRESFLAPLFLLPAVIYILALVAVPFLLAIAFSLSDITTGDPSLDWVGFGNFQAIFDDPIFWRSLRNTLLVTAVTMALTVVLAKALAMILIADFRFKRLIRFLVLLPWTTPIALAAIAWLWMLDSIYSPIDWVLRSLGFIDANLYWLGRDNLALASVIGVQTWRIVPLAAVIIMAGLVAIPDDIKDAAEMDGAGFWRKLWEITIPLNLPVIGVATLFGAILTFTDMTVVYILTRGGPANATQTLPSYAYFKGIEGGDLAQGAAIALFLFPLLLVAAIAILRSVRRMETL